MTFITYLKLKPYPLSLVLMLMILGNAPWFMTAVVFNTDALLRLMRMWHIVTVTSIGCSTLRSVFGRMATSSGSTCLTVEMFISFFSLKTLPCAVCVYWYIMAAHQYQHAVLGNERCFLAVTQIFWSLPSLLLEASSSLEIGLPPCARRSVRWPGTSNGDTKTIENENNLIKI